MGKNKKESCCEKFKTMIGGQALIEGIMMRGPEKDAIVVRTSDGLKIDVKPRKVRSKKSILRWPLIRGVVGFFDSQVAGVKALMHSADIVGDQDSEASTSKFDQWLERKLGNDKFQKLLIGVSVLLGLAMSIGLFFVLPDILAGAALFWLDNSFLEHLLEGLIRILIFFLYMFAVSQMKDMKRVFAYHGAEHKTIRCYEAGLPLTVENVRQQTRLHPRCGTSFLLIVMIISILVFAISEPLVSENIPWISKITNPVLERVFKLILKLSLLPVVVAFSYEVNRFVGRYTNWFTKLLTAPGMLFQLFTTKEPDDSMIEVGIASLQEVLPQQEGADKW